MPDSQDNLLLGKYTEDIRSHYVEYRTARYLIDHPGSTQKQARRAARSAWRKKATASLQKEQLNSQQIDDPLQGGK